jgi:hypothetical protein
MGNEWFEGVEQFIYWGTILTNQSFMHEEIQSKD